MIRRQVAQLAKAHRLSNVLRSVSLMLTVSHWHMYSRNDWMFCLSLCRHANFATKAEEYNLIGQEQGLSRIEG